MGATVQSIISAGSGGTIVDIECHLSNNLPNIVIVGSASKAVDESRERIRGAFATSRIMLPRKRITVNLAPLPRSMAPLNAWQFRPGPICAPSKSPALSPTLRLPP